MPVKSPYPEAEQRTGRQNQLRTDLHFHPELFYSAAYIIPPHSLAAPDWRAGTKNTEMMPHCQGCEHSRNGILWVKRSSLEPLLQVRCIWKPWPIPAWEFTLEVSSSHTSAPLFPSPQLQHLPPWVGAAQKELGFPHTHSTT